MEKSLNPVVDGMFLIAVILTLTHIRYLDLIIVNFGRAFLFKNLEKAWQDGK